LTVGYPGKVIRIARPAASVALRYGLALVSVAAAFGLAHASLYFHLPQPFTALALSAIAITFWYAGTNAGILAALLSLLVRDYFFEPEINALSRVLYSLVFLIFALVMIGVTRARNELELRVAERTAELTRANKDLKLEIAERKRAETELRLAIDTIPALVWTTLPDGSLDFINRRWAEIGLSLDDLRGSAWSAVMHPDERAGVVAKWRTAVETGTPYENVRRVRRADGEYRWFLSRGAPLRGELGKIIKWYGVETDIEDQRRAEDAVRRSEAYLAEAQRLSRTGSFGWRPSTGEIFWSEETFRIFQYDRTTKPSVEIILQRVHPADATQVKRTIDRASQGGKHFDHEYRLVMPDGSVKHVHVVAHALSDESGSIEFVGAVMDVTEQHQARAALENAFDEIQKSEERLRLTLDTIPSTVLSCLPDGSIDFINQRAVEYHGLTLEDLRRDGLEAVYHPEDRARNMDRRRAALAAGTPFEYEARLRRADGVYRWRLIHTVPLRDAVGNIVKWYGTSIDIEDRKRAEEALANSGFANTPKRSPIGFGKPVPTTALPGFRNASMLTATCLRAESASPAGIMQLTSNRSPNNGGFTGRCSTHISRIAILCTAPHAGTDLWFTFERAASHSLMQKATSSVIGAWPPMSPRRSAQIRLKRRCAMCRQSSHTSLASRLWES
jgi:PAS domain S-box-containing protein